MSDFVDVGWYVEINVGRWNKPYVLTGDALLARANAVAAEMAPEFEALRVALARNDIEPPPFESSFDGEEDLREP
jgi:hypothetical protein